MKSVTAIKYIKYSKSYDAIQSIMFSIGPLDYIFRTTLDFEENKNSITISTCYKKRILSQNTISYKEFCYAITAAYTNIKIDNYILNVDKFLHLIYPDIDQALRNSSVKSFDWGKIYKNVELDTSVLNELINNRYITDYLPSIDILISDVDQKINENIRHIEILNNKIKSLKKLNTILIDAKEQ